MKCLVCETFSFRIICKPCLKQIPLTPRVRVLENGIKVYSFYRYEDISYLLRTKYHLVGSRILSLLAQKAARYFFIHSENLLQLCKSFHTFAMGLDDYPYGAYSHTGVILHAFAKESKGIIKPLYGALKAKNRVKYAGQKLAFRKANPKGFIYDKKPRTLILIDDVITTGTSLSEAISIVSKAHSQVLFCLTLCDARNV